MNKDNKNFWFGFADFKQRVGADLKANKKIAVAALKLVHFDQYNCYYGFKQGEKIIDYLKNILEQKLMPATMSQVNYDKLFFSTPLTEIEDKCQKIINSFETKIGSFYSQQERNQGSLKIKSRKGIVKEVPFVRIAIGVAINDRRKITHPYQAIYIAQNLEAYCLNLPKSAFLVDRRRD